jgi:ParB family chromosome partitioning protein
MPDTINDFFKVEIWDVERLRPYPGNPRKMDGKTYAQLLNSIREFGIVDPLVINKQGEVIGGNMRLQAIKELGVEKVPVVIVDLPKNKEKALNLALNKIHGQFDPDLVREFIIDLDTPEIELAGFDTIELENIITDEAFLKGDTYKLEKEPIPTTEDVKVKPGDMYALGRHRLICGDATRCETYEALMEGNHADLLFTDPPYGVGYESVLGKVSNDDLPQDDFKEFTENWMRNVWKALRPGAAFYICSGWSSLGVFMDTLKKVGFKVSTTIVWIKNAPVIGWADYSRHHEQIITGKKTKELPADNLALGKIYRTKSS